jgi:hypothetical protein
LEYFFSRQDARANAHEIDRRKRVLLPEDLPPFSICATYGPTSADIVLEGDSKTQ